nr:NAD(P)-binding domain-containing protein [Ralstonia pseudosolanacearum]
MSIAIIGAGAIGSAIARNLARNGISASISNSRGPESLKTLTDELGPHIKAVSVKDAAQADIVFVAVPWAHLESALKDLGPWNGRVLVDANNAVEVRIEANNVPSFHAVDLGGRASSEVVAQWAPGAKVVKAFNHLIAQPLASGPKAEGGRRVLFLAGQDADAKKSVSDLIVRLGFTPIDLGGVNESRLTQFPGGPLAIINLAHLDQ